MMHTFVLIHGAGDVGWYWHRVESELRARGHDVVAPDLPCEDDSAGLTEYAEAVVEAVGDRSDRGSDLVMVAQSFGGFVAPLVADRLPTRALVLVAGMIPAPGERPEDWVTNTGLMDAEREQPASDDPYELFYHDVPRPLAEEAMSRSRRQSSTPGLAPWPLDAWPDVPTRFVLCTGDRVFPAGFFRRLVPERLGIVPDEIEAGHCVALSRPKELTDLLILSSSI
jgi:pimeloyl-ACP methyl ester carboxylesterase